MSSLVIQVRNSIYFHNFMFFIFILSLSHNPECKQYEIKDLKRLKDFFTHWQIIHFQPLAMSFMFYPSRRKNTICNVSVFFTLSFHIYQILLLNFHWLIFKKCKDPSSHHPWKYQVSQAFWGDLALWGTSPVCAIGLQE